MSVKIYTVHTFYIGYVHKSGGGGGGGGGTGNFGGDEGDIDKTSVQQEVYNYTLHMVVPWFRPTPGVLFPPIPDTANCTNWREN